MNSNVAGRNEVKLSETEDTTQEHRCFTKVTVRKLEN